MSFRKSALAFFGLDFADQARREIEEEREAIGRLVASSLARGSVNIQEGAFQTREDLDRGLTEFGVITKSDP